MEFIHISANIRIAHCPETNIMYCNWMGIQPRQSIMRSGTIILDLLKQHQFTKVLNDNTRVTGPWHTAVKWTTGEWFPAMTQAGLQHFAWVFSPDIFARLSATRAIPCPHVVKIFNVYPEAFNWLSTVS